MGRKTFIIGESIRTIHSSLVIEQNTLTLEQVTGVINGKRILGPPHDIREAKIPFADGNGRTGRLWQSLILQKWKDIFAWIPVETLVYENQSEYYKVLQQADRDGDSTIFVEFMLGMIRNALKINETSDGVNVVTNEEKILAL